jgi:hypothetical protein
MHAQLWFHHRVPNAREQSCRIYGKIVALRKRITSHHLICKAGTSLCWIARASLVDLIIQGHIIHLYKMSLDYQSVNPGKHGFAPEWRGRRRSGISRKAKCVCAADSRVEWGQSGKPKKCCDKSKFLLPVLRSPKKNKMTPLGLLWRHKTGLPDFIRHLYFFWTFRCFRDLMCCKEGGPKCKQEGKVGRNILFPNNDTNLPFDNPAAG